MSEELLQSVPQQIGKYTYHRLGATTIRQLVDSGILPRRNYGGISTKKPDGLVTLHRAAKMVVEWKTPQELQTDTQIAAAIAQEIDVARALCKVLVVTDGTRSFWINALTGDRIVGPDGNEIRDVFHPLAVHDKARIEFLIDEADASLSASNSTLRSASLIDPSPLASRLWQTIWVATGKSPVKCLYNVVELFIFKFLSDLGVLPADIAFANICSKARDGHEDALDFYARNSRPRIQRLFPAGADGTTIINGTIFVNEDGDANLSQALLFKKCLDHLREYGQQFGSLTHIEKQFKTKLYQSFLQQEVEALGQYFTPRRVVQSVVRMAGLDAPSYQFAGQRICDPFCGVGGFLMEVLNLNDGMRASYRPDSGGVVSPPFVMHGFDKGWERDDERTVILAKANMLIYLAELLFAYPQCSQGFAEAFNATFRLFRDNLGTFGHIIEDDSDKYDLILTNPPYVTSGTSIIKEEIRLNPSTKDKYPVGSLGLEGLALQWIVRSLRPGGRAFIIIPDGILARVNGKPLRDHILAECLLDAIISLPVGTFFTNAKHTYILAITKKQDPSQHQQSPVFTYLVSEIGERMTSIRREDIEEDDLPEMEDLFRIFTVLGEGCKEMVEERSLRCKILPIHRFVTDSHWVIDRWWTPEERLEAGIDASTEPASMEEVDGQLQVLMQSLADYESVSVSSALDEEQTAEVHLNDAARFRLFLGKRKYKTRLSQNDDGIPVYSANVYTPMGFMEASNVTDFTKPVILWGIDGNYYLRLLPAGERYATTDHCGAIQILDDGLVPEYVLCALRQHRQRESYHRSFRASLTNMKRIAIRVPCNDDGSLNVERQRQIAEQFVAESESRQQLVSVKRDLDELFARYVGPSDQ